MPPTPCAVALAVGIAGSLLIKIVGGLRVDPERLGIEGLVPDPELNL